MDASFSGLRAYGAFLVNGELKNGEILAEIRSERGRELIGEFQRKFDLVRWGIWYEATLGNNDYQALKDNILPCHEYYPIPDQEVVKSKGNLDNKAYAKYGL